MTLLAPENEVIQTDLDVAKELANKDAPPCNRKEMAEPKEPLGCTETEAPIASLRNVTKAFGSLKVLNNVSLDFNRGEITVILGPSGTGKSVTMKHIVGLLKPDAGEVYFNSQRVDSLTESDLIEVRKQIGFCFQQGALFDSMSVGDNVEFPLIEHSKMKKAERMERVDECLRLVSLAGLESQMPSGLSGGQRKRIALARALALGPTLMCYDEPTAGLDPIRSDVINELILMLNRRFGTTSIVVTHNMQSTFKIADRVLMMYNGKVIYDGSADGLRKSDNPLVLRFIEGQAAEEDLQAIRYGLDSNSSNGNAHNNTGDGI